MKNESGLRDWAPCPPGILSETLSDVRASRWRAVMARRGFFVVISLVCIAVTFSYSAMVRERWECRSIAALLPAYLAGELEGEQIWHVEQHLATCELCRRKLEQMGAQGMRNVPRAPAMRNAHLDNDDGIVGIIPLISMTSIPVPID